MSYWVVVGVMAAWLLIVLVCAWACSRTDDDVEDCPGQVGSSDPAGPVNGHLPTEVVVEALNRSPDKWWEREAAAIDAGPMPGIRVWPLARVALGAVTTDPRVREALVTELHRAAVGDWPLNSPEGDASRWWVDQVLAAFAPHGDLGIGPVGGGR